MGKIFKALSLGLGIGLIVWMVRKIGAHEVLSSFQAIGWKMIWPIVLIAPTYFFYAYSWDLFLDRFEHVPSSFWHILKIKIAGEGANTLTPLNFVGGDPIRIWLLSKSVPVEIGGASVAVDRTLHSLATVGVIFFGIVAAVFKMDLPHYASSLLEIAAVGILALILFFLFFQTRGLFDKLVSLLHTLKIKQFSEGTRKKIQEVDKYVGDFYRRDKKLFILCLALHFAGRLVGVVEVYMIAQFLGVPMGPWEALFFSAVIPVTNMVGSLVPGTIGVLEGVVSTLFLALHWSAADALVLQMVRRIRAFFWIGVGIVMLWNFKHERESSKKTVMEPNLVKP